MYVRLASWSSDFNWNCVVRLQTKGKQATHWIHFIQTFFPNLRHNIFGSFNRLTSTWREVTVFWNRLKGYIILCWVSVAQEAEGFDSQLLLSTCPSVLGHWTPKLFLMVRSAPWMVGHQNKWRVRFCKTTDEVELSISLRCNFTSV